MNRALLGLWLALLLATPWTTGCGRRVVEGADTFVFARGADAQKLDPADVDDGESMKVLNSICEALVRFKPGTTEVEPGLAVSWTISEDGLTYSFTLREGVRFHDGIPLTAESAAFSFLRQLDPAHPAHFPEAAFAYWRDMFSMVESVTASGPMTLSFRLREPHAPFLSSLAIPAASLLSPNFEDPRRPIGTGPFRFVRWIPNERIELAANADYWDGAPSIQRLIFKVVPDNATRLIQLQTGWVHGMDGVDPNDLAVIEKDRSLQLLHGPGLNVAYLAFNCELPPFTDREVRRALAAAINKPDIIRVVYRDAALIARNPLPPFIPGHNDAIPDRQSARQALPALSQPLKLYVMTNPRPYMPNPTRAAQLIKADMEKLGVRVEIVANEWNTHLDRVRHGEHQMALLGWVGDNGDADNFLHVLLGRDSAVKGSALNISFWKHDGYHELMQAARRETDLARRAQIYRQAQELIFEECPMVPLAHAESLLALRANVTGFLFQPNGDMFLHRVRFAPAD
jgi:peptide/nickel transport system substrate-binding protein